MDVIFWMQLFRTVKYMVVLNELKCVVVIVFATVSVICCIL